jgi:CheY-like chemotaxis protein
MANISILMIEDNFTTGQPLLDRIEVVFGKQRWLKSESDFRLAFDELTSKPPQVAVIDVMLKWDIPRREEEKRRQPADAQPMHEAGLRCARMLLTNPATQRIAIILYSNIDREDLSEHVKRLPGNVSYLQKVPDPDTLIDAIRSVVAAKPRGSAAGAR